MEKLVNSRNIFIIATLILSAIISTISLAIPAKFDGFVYRTKTSGKTEENDKIIIEGFFDPVCPYSRDAWPPLKKALHHYGSRVSFIVHPFPLPYHDNAFATSRALHIVNKLNSTVTYSMLEHFFKNQEKFYNAPTHNMSRASVIKRISSLVVKVVGSSLLSSVESGFSDRATDLITRVSFKYSCTRGVSGTPTFFVNGFLLPDNDTTIDYNGWRSIIDPLVHPQSHG
ncbi:hypothetical protein ACHQM5_008927 [Ranunculus cassubicifolius]